jgi:glycosyltransferase involved in cell wall biosynthesis
VSPVENDPRILFIHPDIYAFGGAEQVCVRMMAAAQRLGKVSLVHCGGALDCERVWKWLQVALDPGRVEFLTAGSIGTILGHTRHKPTIKYALALRYARRIVSEFDLIVGSYGECPIPAKHGIQYIHVPMFSVAPDILHYRNVKHDGPLRARLRPLYVHISRRLSGWDLAEIMRKNTLVNSAWTADIVRQVYGVPSLVASPGIDVTLRPGGQGWVDWTNREMGFVMLGRIHPGKRIELGIEVIDRIRNHGHDVQLHLVGRGADGYVKQLERSIVGMPHVHMHLNLPRPELEQLIVRQKFGLHACEYEHYGIAAAEMQALGCVVFAPDFAGQREVVTNPDQRYVDVGDAVTKISKLLNDPDLCRRLAAEGTQRMNDGSAQAFEDRVVAILEKALAD